MRARHRHFNPKSAGASLALDTRYINESDNTTIQTWPDRSGNGRDATQATSTNRATFRSAIQGGNGILRFDGNDRYNASFVTGTEYSLYVVCKRTASNSNAFSNTTLVVSAGVASNTNGSSRRYQLIYSDSSGGIFETTANATSPAAIARNDNWNIHSISAPIGSGTMRYYLNGGSEATANVSALAGVTTGTVRMTVGATSWNNDLYFNGDMGTVVTYEAAHSAAFRKRLEHAAAFSFKISCN